MLRTAQRTSDLTTANILYCLAVGVLEEAINFDREIIGGLYGRKFTGVIQDTFAVRAKAALKLKFVTLLQIKVSDMSFKRVYRFVKDLEEVLVCMRGRDYMITRRANGDIRLVEALAFAKDVEQRFDLDNVVGREEILAYMERITYGMASTIRKVLGECF